MVSDAPVRLPAKVGYGIDYIFGHAVAGSVPPLPGFSPDHAISYAGKGRDSSVKFMKIWPTLEPSPRLPKRRTGAFFRFSEKFSHPVFVAETMPR